MKNLAFILKALSDTKRLRIIKMLEIRPLCVCEISTVLELAYSTVSKHLSILQKAGIIDYQKRGKWYYYHRKCLSGSEFLEVILPQIERWLNEDEEVSKDAEKVNNSSTEEICTLQN